MQSREDDSDKRITIVPEEDEYELLPRKDVKELKEELRKVKEFDVAPTKQLHVSINELNTKIDRLIAIFDEACKDVKIEDGGLSFQEKMKPLVEKMNKILEQNGEIAEGIVALADVIKDFRSDLESPSVLREAHKEMLAPQESVPPPLFSPTPSFGEQGFSHISELQDISEAPTNPPPESPHKKRLFGF